MTTTPQTTRLAGPIAVDGTAGPVRLQARVTNAADGGGLAVQFGYQVQA